MELPISFEEVVYFKNEYRGDLIVTKGVMYYFPHTRVNYARYSDEIGGKDSMVIFDLLGSFSTVFAAVPTLRFIADKSIKAGKFLKRNFRPTTNSPQIRKYRLWHQNISNERLQEVLDNYIEEAKNDRLSFDENSVPKPMRFSVNEIKNAKFRLKFEFDSEYDNHDFKVNLFHRKLFKEALKEGGFLK